MRERNWKLSSENDQASTRWYHGGIGWRVDFKTCAGRQGRAWGSQSLVQATDKNLQASAHRLNTEGHAH